MAEQVEQKARIALVGCGRWSQGWHLPQIQANPKAEIAALACGRAVPELSAKYGCPGFTTVEELLASDVAKTLDGVIVATAHAAHYDIGMKVMAAGLHVFMEKPMTTDLKEALELTEEAERHTAGGKLFMVNNTANWRASTKLAQEMVSRGDIGEVRHASIFFATPLGFLFEDPEQTGWVKPSGSMIGNGFGWGQFAHTFGWFYLVSGLEPQTVFAFTGKSDKSGADIFDAVTILCTNGATVSLSGAATIPGGSKIVQNRLIGSEGMLSYCGSYPIDEGPSCSHTGEGGQGPGSKPANPGQLELTRFDGRNETVPGFEFENVEQGGVGPESLQAFIDGCLGLPFYVGTTAKIGCQCVATIDAMYRSAQSGKAEPVYL